MKSEPPMPMGPHNHPDRSTSEPTRSAFPTASQSESRPESQSETSRPTSEQAASPWLMDYIVGLFEDELESISSSVRRVTERLSNEVERICEKSDRIQNSGEIDQWHRTLAQHRVKKCLTYYRLGSHRGRIELHSHLSAMVYRHIAPSRSHLGFQARYTLIEDFLQGFYIEVLKNFRKENNLPPDYRPRTRIELAEYMAFSEQYAKRRINMSGRRNQQLIVLRAQAFSQRQPVETSMDIELAVESAKTEEAEMYSRSPMVKLVRDQMVADVVDPADSVLRDRVINELIQYLEDQGQEDCVNYLTLKLKDFSAPEIDELLNLTPRERDYLQQRFKYHVEKFACSHNWQIVHQWLGADLDQNLGMPQQEWNEFLEQLSPMQRKLLHLKGEQHQKQEEPMLTDRDIAKVLNCTPKQVQRHWVRLLSLAWKFRNSSQSV